MKIARYLPLLGLLIIPSLASAMEYSNVPIGDFKYTLNDNDPTNMTAVVKGLNPAASEVVNPVIPATVKYSPNGEGGEELTFKVTTVGGLEGANIKGTLTLSEGILTIKDSAFQGCTNLTSTLTIPSTVETIERFAFQG